MFWVVPIYGELNEVSSGKDGGVGPFFTCKGLYLVGLFTSLAVLSLLAVLARKGRLVALVDVTVMSPPAPLEWFRYPARQRVRGTQARRARENSEPDVATRCLQKTIWEHKKPQTFLGR